MQKKKKKTTVKSIIMFEFPYVGPQRIHDQLTFKKNISLIKRICLSSKFYKETYGAG